VFESILHPLKLFGTSGLCALLSSLRDCKTSTELGKGAAPFLVRCGELLSSETALVTLLQRSDILSPSNSSVPPTRFERLRRRRSAFGALPSSSFLLLASRSTIPCLPISRRRLSRRRSHHPVTDARPSACSAILHRQARAALAAWRTKSRKCSQNQMQAPS